MTVAGINDILLALMTLAVCYAFYRDACGVCIPERAGEREERIAIILIASAGIFLRVYRFGSVPGGFNQDGAMAAVDGKALADYLTDRYGTFMPAHLYAWGYGQMSSLLSYLIAVSVKLFGLSPVTARLPQLLASIMGGAFFFLFMREVFGRRAGLIALLLLAVDPWHLVQSRWALDCNLFPHFFMGGVYLLQRGLNGKTGALYKSMVFFGLSMYCYGVSVYSVPLFLLLGCAYALMTKKLRPSSVLGCAAVYLLIAWPFILTMAVNYFGWDTVELPFVTLQRFDHSVRKGDILFFSDNIPAQLRQNFRMLMNVICQRDDLLWNTVPGFGTMFVFSVPLMIGGLVKLFRDFRWSGRVLSLLMLITGLAVGLITDNVNVNRANLMMYPMMLLVSLGICYVIQRVRFSALPMLCTVLAAGLMLSVTYFGGYADSIKHEFFWGFGEALHAAKDTGRDVIYVTADTQYEGSGSVSEILTLFYDQTDALYYQGKTNKDHGRELLPYSQRFVYISMDPSAALLSGDDAAFVIRRDDAPYFPGYTVTVYGDYAMAVR